MACNGGLADISIIASGGTAPYVGDGPVTGLNAGSYSFNIADDNGCITSVPLTITEPTLLSTSFITTNVACPSGNNGAIDLTVTGGIAPYIFTWSNSASTEDLSSLTAGNYSVSVTDANGCTANANVTITQPTLLTTSASSTNVTCNGLNNGTATVTAAGGTAPYTYLWSNGATTAS
ncbi:MAG: adhesin, partial [Betaproteobacteria bacterium]|nr:adhesin [Betaproteobacteria bacterium]